MVHLLNKSQCVNFTVLPHKEHIKAIIIDNVCVYTYICIHTQTYIYFIGNYVLYVFIHLNSQQPYKGEGNVLHGWITEADQGQIAGEWCQSSKT